MKCFYFCKDLFFLSSDITLLARKHAPRFKFALFRHDGITFFALIVTVTFRISLMYQTTLKYVHLICISQSCGSFEFLYKITYIYILGKKMYIKFWVSSGVSILKYWYISSEFDKIVTLSIQHSDTKSIIITRIKPREGIQYRPFGLDL